MRAYAGSAPVTRASGKSLVIMQRKVKNQRLAAAGYSWTFAALTASPIVVAGLAEPPRYFMQHNLGYQVHDVTKPHHPHQHGVRGTRRQQ